MWLVLCEAEDTAGAWIYLRLKERGFEPLELVLPEELAGRARLRHLLAPSGSSSSVTLPSGAVVRSRDLKGVVNRLWRVPPTAGEQLDPKDQAYLEQEWHACLASWLFSLECPVLNPPTENSLSGDWRDCAGWAWLALECGLDVPVFHTASYQSCGCGCEGAHRDEEEQPAELPQSTVLIVGGQAFGPEAPEAVLEGCRRMSYATGMPLLAASFRVHADGEWHFETATTMPDLRLGGPAALDALTAALGA